MLWIPEDGNLKKMILESKTRHENRWTHGPRLDNQTHLIELLVVKNE